MAKRIFIAFAIEDERFRDFVVGQAKNKNTPFDFVDMSVKKAWETDWHSRCRDRIKTCDGMIALVSKNTYSASGEIFEIQCAIDEKLPLMPMYINDDRPYLPSVLQSKRISVWSWDNLESFVDSL